MIKTSPLQRALSDIGEDAGHDKAASEIDKWGRVVQAGKIKAQQSKIKAQ